MSRILPAGLIALALATSLGCTRSRNGGPAKGDVYVDGDGVVLVFARKSAVWVTIRASAESRTLGWKAGAKDPVLVVYATRGFNPAFTGGRHETVAWIDGNKVLRIDTAAEDAKYVSPPQEVSAALVVPDGYDVTLRAGDTVNVVEAGS